MFRWIGVALALLAWAGRAEADGALPWRQGNVQPKGDAGFWYMASDGGFAAAQGLALEIFAFTGDTILLKALIGGELDSFEGSPISPMVAASKGADLKVLGCSWPKLTYSIFARPELHGLADLGGRSVGVSAPGSLPELVARTMIRQAGLSPDRVDFVMAGNDADRLRAVMAGTIDAAVSTSDFAARPGLELKTLGVANATLPQFLRSCIVTRGDVLRTKREALVRLMAAEIAAYSYALDHRDAVIALAYKKTGLPPSDPTPAVDFDEVTAQHEVSPTLAIDPAKFLWLRDLLAREGRVAAKFDPAAMIDPTIRAEALRRLGQGG